MTHSTFLAVATVEIRENISSNKKRKRKSLIKENQFIEFAGDNYCLCPSFSWAKVFFVQNLPEMNEYFYERHAGSDAVDGYFNFD